MVAKSKVSQVDAMNQAAAAYHKPIPKRESFGGITPHGLAMSAKIREQIAALAHKKPDRSWAQKVIDRHARGENVSAYALQCAFDAVGQPEEREPGSDDE